MTMMGGDDVQRKDGRLPTCHVIAVRTGEKKGAYAYADRKEKEREQAAKLPHQNVADFDQPPPPPPEPVYVPPEPMGNAYVGK